MKAFAWIITGAAVAVAVAYIVLNQPGGEYETGDPDVEDVANRTALWGSKQRLTGTGTGIVGKIKEGVGRATGNDTLAGEGVGDQLVGAVKDTAGKVAQAAGQTIHEVNQ
jgi:uncharacterized protein YjbJ (UPF0337 family)